MQTLTQGNRDHLRLPHVCAGETHGAECLEQPIDGSPVPLCPRHMRRVYEFAQGVIDANWRDGLRDLLGEQPEPEPERQGWVYFIERKNRIKIGYTTDPAGRFASLRPDQVLHVEPGDMQDEKTLHALFAQHWITGEWFQPTQPILDYIARHRQYL